MWGVEAVSAELTPARSTPTLVPHLTGAVSVSAGSSHSLALRNDGTVWAWGYGFNGQLGNNEGTLYTAEPVQTVGLTDVVTVAGGGFHSLALRNDGTLWAWGSNNMGQLGDGTREDRYTPVQVTAIDQVAAVYASEDYSAVIRQDGTVWTWGGGFGFLDPPGQPQQVVGLPPVVSLAFEWNHFYALAADGSLWEWMDWGPWAPAEAFPVEGAPTDAVSLAFSGVSTHVLRADGTVWSAGNNYSGALGIPGAGMNEPWAQVPGLSDVVALEASGGRVHATRADGTVVSWGSNGSGAIGDGVSPLHLSPVRVPVPCRLPAVGQREGTPPCPAQP
jgi:alpha-tubulin suppressor-like RCC1 family protein